MQRAPSSLVFLTIVGMLLGCLLVADGLHARLFSSFALADAWWPWHTVARQIGWKPAALGWPLITFGIWWVTGVGAAWLHTPAVAAGASVRWIRNVLLALSIFTLLLFWGGTILAACAFVVLWTPGLRRWLAAADSNAT